MSAEVLDITMSDGRLAPFAHERAIDAFGVRLAVGASDEDLLATALAALPPRADPCPASQVGARFGLMREEFGIQVVANGGLTLGSPDPELAAGLLAALVRTHVAQHAHDHIFIQGGVVAHRGRAIVLPGGSLSGRSTLVAELVRAGALPYSDEYAVLDRDGAVHAYSKVEHDAPVRAGLVAVTTYVPDTTWRPAHESPSRGVLAVLPHCPVVRERPRESLAAARRLAADAVVLVGDRGEASAVAPKLLSRLETDVAGARPSH